MSNELELEMSDSGAAAYLRLPKEGVRDGAGTVSKTIHLIDLIGTYQGPQLLFDFGSDRSLIGNEILVGQDDDEVD